MTVSLAHQFRFSLRHEARNDVRFVGEVFRGKAKLALTVHARSRFTSFTFTLELRLRPVG